MPIWKCRNTKQLLRQHNVAKKFMKSNQNSELLLYNLRLKTKVKYSKVHYKAIPISANFFSKLFSIVPKNTHWVLFFDILTHKYTIMLSKIFYFSLQNFGSLENSHEIKGNLKLKYKVKMTLAPFWVCS